MIMVVGVGVAARVIHCELQPQKPPQKVGPGDYYAPAGPDQVKVVLQPRLCTLRSYAPDRGGVIRTTTTVQRSSSSPKEVLELSPFLENLYEYIESTKNSQDFEILTGRLAMMVFATIIGVELATGNSVFKKMDVQGIAEGVGACFAAVTCAAAFAYSSSARKRVGRIFTISCNAFIDALIDNIVDGLFYDEDPDDRSNNEEIDL